MTAAIFESRLMRPVEAQLICRSRLLPHSHRTTAERRHPTSNGYHEGLCELILVAVTFPVIDILFRD